MIKDKAASGHTLVPDANLARMALASAALERLRDHVVALWHEGRIGGDLTIHEALGMTPGKYAAWVEQKS